MSFGACRALEICTFAKKECTGANEPGSEGESPTKTREVTRGSHARWNTLLTGDCGKSNLLSLVVVSSLPILLGQFCPHPNLAFTLVQHENEIGRVFLEFVKFDRHDLIEEIKFDSLRSLWVRHCPAKMLLTLKMCDQPPVCRVWGRGRQVVARKQRAQAIGLDEAPKHTPYRYGQKTCGAQKTQFHSRQRLQYFTRKTWGTVLQSIIGPQSVFYGASFQGSLILPSRFAICCLHNKTPARAMGCNTINRIPRTYRVWFTSILLNVGC